MAHGSGGERGCKNGSRGRIRQYKYRPYIRHTGSDHRAMAERDKAVEHKRHTGVLKLTLIMSPQKYGIKRHKNME